MELKKPYPSKTGRRGADAEWAGPKCMCGGYKFGRDILGVRSPNPATGPPAQDSSARKISPHNFWLQKTSRD